MIDYGKNHSRCNCGEELGYRKSGPDARDPGDLDAQPGGGHDQGQIPQQGDKEGGKALSQSLKRTGANHAHTGYHKAQADNPQSGRAFPYGNNIRCKQLHYDSLGPGGTAAFPPP